MDREDAVRAVLEDAAARRVPGELDVALVAGDEDVVGPPPGRGGAEVVEPARRVAGRVHPEAQRSRRVSRVDGGQVDAPRRVHRDRDGAAARERRPHRVGRVADRRVQDRVPFGTAEPQPLRQPGDELFGTDACRDRRWIDGDTEAPRQPACRRFAVGGAAHRRRVAALRPRPRQRVDHRRRWRVGRGADGEVDAPAVERVGHCLQVVESVVRVRRRLEAARRLGRHASTTYSRNLPAPAPSMRARSRVAPSSCTSTSTSPSRCTAASTSPRS